MQFLRKHVYWFHVSGLIKGRKNPMGNKLFGSLLKPSGLCVGPSFFLAPKKEMILIDFPPHRWKLNEELTVPRLKAMVTWGKAPWLWAPSGRWDFCTRPSWHSWQRHAPWRQRPETGRSATWLAWLQRVKPQHYWLVVQPPLWKLWVTWDRDDYSRKYGKYQYVPNH